MYTRVYGSWFVQNVVKNINITYSLFIVDFGLALPTRLNSSHLLFEKLLKAYNCAQECDAYQFFHVTFTEQVGFFRKSYGQFEINILHSVKYLIKPVYE